MADKKEIRERLSSLRNAMIAEGLSALIVPQADPHGSEYVASRWQTRRHFSGFTGSAGPLVVTADRAWVIADSRYWLQAAEQLEATGIEVIEQGRPDAPDMARLLGDNLKAGNRVGVDGQLVSAAEFDALSSQLADYGLELVATEDIPGRVWSDRPELPTSPVIIHELKYSGEAAQAKIALVRDQLAKSSADGALIPDLAVIAWMLNLRSTDVKYNPVLISYLYINKDTAILFIDERKLTDEVRAYLAYIGVTTAPYDVIFPFLRNLEGEGAVLVDRGSASAAIRQALGDRYKDVDLPIREAKACRSEIQIAGTRAAMERDGAALVKGFMEIERRVRDGISTTELDVDAIISARRAEQPLFFDLSFETIAGYGPHGAIVHYSATPESAATLRPEGLLLVDSGASYLDGTTDITRTIALGPTTPEMRRDFTNVLKGTIALASAIFPAGTRGAQLDILARRALWSSGANYLHGTGHGVGHFLNVHEGPQSIRLQENPQPLRPGMVTSDEPGVYRAGRYGIRLENLILTVPAFDDPEYGPFLKFETLTLFPFDTTVVDPDLMTVDEICWLNDYHEEVLRRLSPYLNNEERDWLEEKCQPLKPF